jgi:hypothetical protein
MTPEEIIGTLRKIHGDIGKGHHVPAMHAITYLITRIDREAKLDELDVFVATLRNEEISTSDLPAALRRLADSMEPF